MQSDLFTCSVCQQEYNLAERMPRSLIPCAHAICSACLSKILSDSHRCRCPFDNSALTKDINKFPVHYVLRELLEKRSKTKLCPIHQKEKTIVCLDERQQICYLCVNEHSKKGHLLEAIEVVTEETKRLTKETKDSLEDIETCRKRLDTALKEKYSEQIIMLKKIFSEIKELITDKENEIIFEASSFYKIQKNKVKELIGEKSELVRELSDKYFKLNKSLNDEMGILDHSFFNSLKEKVKQTRTRMNISVIQTNLNEQYEEMNDSLIQAFKAQEDYLAQFKLKFVEPLGFLSPIFSDITLPKTKENSMDQTKRIAHFKVKSNLKFTFHNMTLAIKNLDTAPQNLDVEIGRWVEAQQVSMTFEKGISKLDSQLISYVFRNLKQVSTFNLLVTPEGINPDLCRVLAKIPNTISCLTINAEGCNADESSMLIPSIQKMLRKLNNLVKLTLDMEEIILQSKTIQPIIDQKATDLTKLEVFSLNLRYSNVSDEQLKNLFIPMPSIRNIEIHLDNSNVTDESIKLFSQAILTSARQLEEITLVLDYTEITDIGVESLLSGLRNIKAMRLSFNFTKISDKAFSSFPRMLESSNQLEVFSISLNGTQITDESSLYLFPCLPNATFFFINFISTFITDDAIEIFTKQTLASMKKIETLKIWLNSTRITDKSIAKLLTSVDNVKQLTLGLASTDITDLSIGPFIKDKLPLMSNLLELDFRVSNTLISQELQDQIRVIMQNYKNHS